MQHRPEIDGLRAAAVMPVVAVHAGCPALPGGHLGVDVFFVVSGYLITSLILESQARGTFTLCDFYERRARRILPALVVMLAVTLLLGALVVLPPAFRHLALSAGATSLFASNLYALRTTDYFAAPAERVPLVHTWSLGVEEQFYLLFPAFVLLVLSRPRAILVLALLSLASLGLAQWTVTAYPAAGFYLLPTRAWELLAGSLVAYGTPRLAKVPHRIRDILASGGLAALLATFVLYDRSTPVPGLHALLPVAATALVVAFATAETRAGRLLSSRPLPAIGRISYSTYLWHQPLFALARHLTLGAPPAYLFAALSLAAFALGALSWRFVEQPFRSPTWLSRAQVVALAAGSSLLLVAVALLAYASDGFPGRFAPATLRLMQPAGSWARDPCHRTGQTLTPPAESCVLGDARNVVGVLVGDSHGAAVAQDLGPALATAGIGLLQLTFNGCPPLPDVYRTDMGLAHDCAGFHRDVRTVLAQSPALVHVIVVARWTRILSPTGFDNGEGGVELTHDRIAHLRDGRPLPQSDAERNALTAAKTAATVHALLDLGKRVLLVYPIPEVGWDAPTYLARRDVQRRLTGRAAPVASTRFATYLARNREAFAMLDRIGAHARLARVYPHSVFCNTVLPGRCVFQAGDEALYTDHNHLSAAGARLLAPHIVQALTDARQGP